MKLNELALELAKAEDENSEIEKVEERIPYAFPWNRRLKEATRVEWSSTDSADAFDSNLKNHKDKLEKYATKQPYFVENIFGVSSDAAGLIIGIPALIFLIYYYSKKK